MVNVSPLQAAVSRLTGLLHSAFILVHYTYTKLSLRTIFSLTSSSFTQPDHSLGHAFCPNSDKISKINILPSCLLRYCNLALPYILLSTLCSYMPCPTHLQTSAAFCHSLPITLSSSRPATKICFELFTFSHTPKFPRSGHHFSIMSIEINIKQPW